ncbi:hypothetical protein RZS08_37530, partial [Arthrospira platensis SPKY1]|nr:hypothetical protein [Arthrospira platensis SPKY1]
ADRRGAGSHDDRSGEPDQLVHDIRADPGCGQGGAALEEDMADPALMKVGEHFPGIAGAQMQRGIGGGQVMGRWQIGYADDDRTGLKPMRLDIADGQHRVVDDRGLRTN